ncbi:hypothetical protein [Jatrophihabitans endophyticus]|uniref:hypothetical protein n=1 Tax=Jatrophihabitans endophyticus TaxID=1206085 RepID=UPI0026ECAC34|nr:hypothetical protein [Jatrophihabitans endophyticus]
MIAEEMGRVYSQIMQADVELVTVSIHALGAGSVWRCTGGDAQEAALLMCDIRSGRSPAIRAELARAPIEICVEQGQLDSQQIKVEFTQHPGEDMYHPHLGGFNQDWTAAEPSE